MAPPPPSARSSLGSLRGDHHEHKGEDEALHNAKRILGDVFFRSPRPLHFDYARYRSHVTEEMRFRSCLELYTACGYFVF